MVEYFDRSPSGRWRQIGVAAAFLALAFFLMFLPNELRTAIRQGIQGTVLRPFIWAQAELVASGARAMNLSELRAQRDSLLVIVTAQSSLAEENRRLRQLLALRDRASKSFVAAEVVRVGTPGGESGFLLNVGGNDGVAVGSPVIAASGLLGVVQEVGPTWSQGIDWTHPDFRASAMTADGQAYGIVESRRGRYREEDELALVGAPFHVEVPPGTRVVTSGRGGIYPRGILLGTVLGIEEADTGWRKSYLLRPAVRPGAVAHVLVGVGGPESRTDLSDLWSSAPPLPDSSAAAEAGR